MQMKVFKHMLENIESIAIHPTSKDSGFSRKKKFIRIPKLIKVVKTPINRQLNNYSIIWLNDEIIGFV